MTLSTAPAARSLSERRRWTTQVEIAEAAAALFARQGYDATTVEQIAGAAGIALRTFYRYCTGKDDVFTAVIGRNVAVLVQVFRESDPAMGLRELVVGTFAGRLRTAQELPLADRLGALLTTIPQLRARLHAAEYQTQELLLPLLAQRMGLDPSGLDVRLVALLVVSGSAAAVEHAAASGRALDDCLAEVMDRVERRG